MNSAPAATCRSCIVRLLARSEPSARQRAHLHGNPGRPCGGRRRLFERSSRRAAAEALGGQHARLPLARTHRDRRVALEELHRVEPLGRRGLQLLRRSRPCRGTRTASRKRSTPRAAGRRGLRLDAASARSSSDRRRGRPRDPSAAATSSPASLPLRHGGLGRPRAGHGARPRAPVPASRSAGTPASPRRKRAAHPPARAGSSKAPGRTRSRRDRRTTFCPDVEPGRPTVTPVTRRRPWAETIVEPANHREPFRPAALGPKIDDGDLGSGVPQRPGGRVARVVRRRGPPRAGRGARRSDGGAAARRKTP